MANDFSLMATRITTELSTLSAIFTNLSVQKMARWEPAKISAFERYAICLCPANTPWDDSRITSVRGFQTTYRFDLYLLVKNYDELNSVYGDTAPNLGIFELVARVKELLRVSTLSGLLDKTYTEVNQPLQFESAASAGFDTGEHSLVRRVQLRYEGRTQPWCQPVTET